MTHLRVSGGHLTLSEVERLRTGLPAKAPEIVIAVGGGTVMDAAKVLNAILASALPAAGLLAEDLSEVLRRPVRPLLAIPTTAGTGAEATSFAVLYDGDKKHSIEHPALMPSDVLLVPDFTASVPPYQAACSGFDAFAQATESLWARGATDESRAYARKALRLCRCLPDAVHAPTPLVRADMQQAAYWSGRAINISKTTAAHAFSYVLTAHYGVPHGHAVAMLLPAIIACNRPAMGAVFDDFPEIDSAAVATLARSLGLAPFSDLLSRHPEAAQVVASSADQARLANNPVMIDPDVLWREITADDRCPPQRPAS